MFGGLKGGMKVFTLGIIVGILIAPDKGEITRDKIREKITNAVDSLLSLGIEEDEELEKPYEA